MLRFSVSVFASSGVFIVETGQRLDVSLEEALVFFVFYNQHLYTARSIYGN
jgi:hypothetical protein